ncbi:MAG: hypothetical protein IIA77_04980 [Proteobacteria bacterium]|nr:hypothetical protein [Pseudomonadota bacterium]
MGEVIKFSNKEDDYYGGCPHCKKNDGYLNIWRVHYFVCHEHKVRWCVGRNLFSSWRFESMEDWDRNIEKIKHYEEVDLVY